MRLAILRRWIAIPLRDRTLLLALVAALSVPAFLVASADHWATAAADGAVSRLVADRSESALGVSVETVATFAGPEPLETADGVVAARAADPALGDPVRTMTTFRALGMIAGENDPLGIPLRMIARPGAVESLDVVSANPDAAGGVWISQWLAEDAGLGVGDRLVFESSLEPEDPGAETFIGGGPTVELTIAGVYRTLWSVDGAAPPPYWRTVTPAGIVPTYIRPFAEPNFSLLVTDRTTLASSGVTGSVRWDVALQRAPTTFAELDRLERRYRELERSLATDRASIDVFEELSPTGMSVSVESALFEIHDDAVVARRLVRGPIGSARSAGIVVALAVAAASGVLVVRRRHTEYRLLAAEGERWWRIGSRTLAQLVLPAALGVILGVGAAAVNAGVAFPEAPLGWRDADWSLVAWTVAGCVLVASLASGLAAQATLDTGRLVARSVTAWPAAVAVAASIALWVQVGRASSAGSDAIDITVVGLPVAVLIAAVLLVVLALDLLRGRLRRLATPRRVGAVGFLAVRRTASEQVGGRLAIAALGVGLGLLLFSWVLAATLERSGEVKSAVVAGGEAAVELLAHPPPGTVFPPATTLIGISTTKTVPGDASVTIVAIDPATFVGAVAWPDEYGGSPRELVALLESDAEGGLPVVGIEGQAAPATGSFGTFQMFPYRIVDRYAALPFAGGRGATLAVSAAALDRFERARLGLDEQDSGAAEGFLSPVRRFRPHLVSAQSGEILEDFAASLGLTIRATTTRVEISESVDAIAARAALGYLRLLGLVGAVVAAVALGLYLSMRRRANALATVLTVRMGLPPRRAALVTTLEAGLLATIAVMSAAAVGPSVAGRLVARFDANVSLPPRLGVVVPATVVVAIGGLLLLVVSTVWIAERLAARRPAEEVLRDAT